MKYNFDLGVKYYLSIFLSDSPKLLLFFPIKVKKLWFSVKCYFCSHKHNRPCPNQSKHMLPLWRSILYSRHSQESVSPARTRFIPVLMWVVFQRGKRAVTLECLVVIITSVGWFAAQSVQFSFFFVFSQSHAWFKKGVSKMANFIKKYILLTY